MAHIIRLQAAILTLSLTHAAFAAQDSPNYFDLGIGTDVTSFHYRELCTPSDTETAQFESLLADVKIHPVATMSNVELRYESASVNSDYSGEFLASNAPVTAKDPLKFTNYEGDINVALSDDVFVYVGYGHHIWNRFLAAGTGYREIYTWDYTPVGVMAWAMKTDTVDLGVDFSIRPSFNGNINVITSQTVANGQDSNASLGAKTGFKIKVPVRWHTGNFSVTTSPWFEHSEVGFSNSFTNTTLFGASAGYEPSSVTEQYGLEVLLGVSI